MTPKLTHKERAEKLNSELVDIQDKIEWRADLFIPVIEKAFHQVANEALEEAESLVDMRCMVLDPSKGAGWEDGFLYAMDLAKQAIRALKESGK